MAEASRVISAAEFKSLVAAASAPKPASKPATSSARARPSSSRARKGVDPFTGTRYRSQLAREPRLASPAQRARSRSTTRRADGHKATDGISGCNACTDTALRARVSFLESRLADTERQLSHERTTEARLEHRDLQLRYDAVCAEVQRLQRVNGDLRAKRRAAPSAAETEALALAASKSALLVSTADALDAAWRELREVLEGRDGMHARCAHLEADLREAQTALAGLRSAPLEIQRLQDRLRSAETESASRRAHADDEDVVGPLAHSDALARASRERDFYRTEAVEWKAKLEAVTARSAALTDAARSEVESTMLQRVTVAAKLAADREAALADEARQWRTRTQHLEQRLASAEEAHCRDVESQRVKEQRRQENLLRTLGAYDKARQADQLRALHEGEQRLQRQMDELQAEKDRWEADFQRRQQELAIADAAAARASEYPAAPVSSTAAVSAPPVTAPPAATVSDHRYGGHAAATPSAPAGAPVPAPPHGAPDDEPTFTSDTSSTVDTDAGSVDEHGRWA